MDCTKQLMNVVAAVCDTPATAGTQGQVILLPYGGIDRILSEVTDNVIKSIIMRNNAKGNTFDTLERGVLGAPSLVAGTYVNSWQHDVTLRIFVKNEDVKKFVNAFTNSRVVAIVQNNEVGNAGDVMYEAYGWDAGLKLNEATGDTTMADGLVYEITAGNDDQAKERSLPKSVFITDIATTETMLNSLVA